MNAVDEGLATMARVGRRARWIIWGCGAFLIGLLAIVSLELPKFLLDHPQIAPLVPGNGEVQAALAAMPLAARGLLFLILLVSAAPFLWALREAAVIARLMAAGEGFSPALPRHLRRIGWALVLTLISRPLAGMGLTAFVTHHLSQSVAIPRAVTLAFSSDDLGFALIGIAVLALAAIARSIVALADDARGIV